MMKFKYDHSVLITTEYVEALALYCFCEFNNLDFDKEIKKRPKELVNSFPDFVIGDRNLEVVRAVGRIEGKQQKDIVDVFGKKNSEKAVRNKNNELKKYTGENNHHITFRVICGVSCAFPDLRNSGYLKEEIEKAISLKYDKYKNKTIDKKTDLFVVTYEALGDERLEGVFEWYKNNEASTLFSSTYIFLPYEENSSSIVRMDCEQKVKKQNITDIDKNKLAELIFDLGWLDRNKYILDF